MNKALAMKIYNVMCDTEGLEKDLSVGTGNNSYRAIGEKAVLNMIKPLFKEHKLILIPKDGTIEENVFAYVDGYGKNKLRAITQLKVVFTIIDAETGESTDIVGFGNGADSQDKGSGKAFTYALKTALSKTFMLFSGEDTDNHHSDEIGGNNEGEGETETISTIQLVDIAKEKGFDEAFIIKANNDRKGSNNVTEVKYINQEIKKILYKKFEISKSDKEWYHERPQQIHPTQ